MSHECTGTVNLGSRCQSNGGRPLPKPLISVCNRLDRIVAQMTQDYRPCRGLVHFRGASARVGSNVLTRRVAVIAVALRQMSASSNKRSALPRADRAR